MRVRACVSTFYYPNWRVRGNGQNLQVSYDDDGAIIIPITTADSRVELHFQETAMTRIATWFSAAAWLILAAFGLSRAVERAYVKLQ